MFDRRYYDRLGRLRLAIEKKSNASMQGGRKSSRKGNSAEFSDFREYMPGDDIRSIDWNAYARLDRLYIKEFMEEKESTITFILDFSRSMEYGEKKKSELASELTAALSYIALLNQDRVMVLDAANPARRFYASGGKAGYRNLERFLESTTGSEPADLFGAVKSLDKMQAGLTIVISDFMSEDFIHLDDKIPPSELPLVKMIRYLKFRKQSVVLLHVLAKEETDITLEGTCNLIDSEDNDSKLRVTMDSESIGRYNSGLKAFTGNLKSLCKKNGASYHLCNTGTSFDRIIFNELKDLYEW
ncbi:MAG: DUF58 domain-containing protein [Lachnospiraceae bacterium]|nr:DUF58 domain-containing protein [Lachnospiraceae bacterium]